MRAHIDTLNKTFAHIHTPQGRVFLHQHDCDFELQDAAVGDVLEVEVEPSPRGLRAVAASWVQRPQPDVTEGIVANVVPHRGIAFMVPDGAARNQQVLLHVTAFTDYIAGESESFASLAAGQRVRCIRRPTEKGDRGYDIQVV